ncbi:MAG: hypothetical protein Q8R70_09765 [Methanoregula sp.]|nr:hypothetical protein [Methanoregula sp.]
MRIRKIHPIINGIIHTALRTCEGVRFHPGPVCSSCGSHLSGYDERKKRFAILLEDEISRPLYVIIQRSYCHNCGLIAVPEEPFYPGTRIGSPVVDLCRSLSATMPYSRVSTYLERMGVLVNRWSARYYSCTPLPEVPAVEIFGMQLPCSIITLSMLDGTLEVPGDPGMEEILAACNYPSLPFRTRICDNEDNAANPEQENRQKIIDGFVSRFPLFPVLLFISFWILVNLYSGTASYFPDEFLGFPGLEVEELSIY